MLFYYSVINHRDNAVIQNRVCDNHCDNAVIEVCDYAVIMAKKRYHRDYVIMQY